MRNIRCLLSLLAPLVLAAPFHAAASNGAAAFKGGNFATGTAAGQFITLKSAPLAATNATLSFSCPITTYGAGTYALNWTCAGGTVTIKSTDHSLALNGAFISGSMTFTSSGGGRGGHTVSLYQFYGSFRGTITSGGVTQYTYGSVSQSVDTSGQIGTATAPVSAGAFGWNSGYSPLALGDASKSRVLFADNIAGANLLDSSIAGGVGKFGAVGGLAQDASLRLYATDSTLDRLVRVDDSGLSGAVTLGSPGVGLRHFNKPQGVAVDASGKIWVADAGNNRVVRFDDMTGANWTTFGTPGAGTDQFSSPASIAFDRLGRIYVADKGNNRLVRFDDITGAGWTTLTQVPVGSYSYPLTAPSSIATNAAGQVYVALASGYLIRVDDISGLNGSASYWGGALTAISVDKAGTIYVAGNFVPGLAQVEDAAATGYFASALGTPSLQVSALLALSTPQPTPAAPVLSINALNFGSRNVGVPTPAQHFTLLNLGASPLTFTSIDAPADYRGTTGCPLTLAGGALCAGTLLFEPVTTGVRNADFTITTNGVHATETIALTGVGTAPHPVLFPASLSFNPQRTGALSSFQTVTMTNAGSGPLTIKSLVASAGFTQKSNCLGIVPAGGGCTIQIGFQPAAAGVQSGSITITDDAIATGTHQVIPLTGSGTSGVPTFSLSPESLLFPDQQVSTISSSQTLRLTNTSGATFSLSTPGYAAGFTLSSACGALLANGASCNYYVKFAPTKSGPITSSLLIPVKGSSPIRAGLTGKAVAAASTSALSATPGSLAFGGIAIGDNPSLSTILLNTSGLPHGIRSVRLTGDSTFSISGNSCAAVLAGGTACAIDITFLPLSTSNYLNNGLLTIIETTGAVTQVPITGYAVAAGG